MPTKIAQQGTISNGNNVVITFKKYNYNPFTGNFPIGDWIYYVYQLTANEQHNFVHQMTNVSGDDVWILAAGPGGEGGMASTEKGSSGGGGGGGPGEIVLKVISAKLYNGVSCTIGTLCNSIDTLSENNFTTIKHTLESSDTLSIRACGGFKGNDASIGAGGRGGNGGGSCVGVSNTEITTFNTSDKTPKKSQYRFGSGYGGGGCGEGLAKNGFYGNQVTASWITGTTYDYKNIDNSDQSRKIYGEGCIVDFGKTLNKKQCDNTGTVNMLSGGNGGKVKSAGNNGPPGFIMIFHKTKVPLV